MWRMMSVNLSEPGVVRDQLDKHHVIPQITLSTDMLTHIKTHNPSHRRILQHHLCTFVIPTN